MYKTKKIILSGSAFHKRYFIKQYKLVSARLCKQKSRLDSWKRNPSVRSAHDWQNVAIYKCLSISAVLRAITNKHSWCRAVISCSYTLCNPRHDKTCFLLYVNNKGADQPAPPHSLIYAFVVPCLDSIITLLAIAEISRPKLVSVAEQAGFSLTEDRFSHDVAHFCFQ